MQLLEFFSGVCVRLRFAGTTLWVAKYWLTAASPEIGPHWVWPEMPWSCRTFGKRLTSYLKDMGWKWGKIGQSVEGCLEVIFEFLVHRLLLMEVQGSVGTAAMFFHVPSLIPAMWCPKCFGVTFNSHCPSSVPGSSQPWGALVHLAEPGSGCSFFPSRHQ